MAFQIEAVKESELNILRDISITTFKTTFENGGYSEDDFNQYFEEAYNIETLTQELKMNNPILIFIKKMGKLQVTLN